MESVDYLGLPIDFNPGEYLRLNPDLISAKVDPIWHYLNHGCREGRRYKSDRYAQEIAAIRDILIYHASRNVAQHHRNPINRAGQKCFSQTDEDGITLEILRRLGLERGVYAEFGVGNGLENNTLILAALDWKGFWVGGEDLAFDAWNPRRFHYIKDWVKLDNVLIHARRGLQALGAQNLDVVSLDLDGNDFYFVEALLNGGVTPSLFIVEYNAKFPPPVRFTIQYDALHRWAGDDYFGASLASFVDLFGRHDYRLVCCNAHSGANAFFVKNALATHFDDVSTEMNELYMPPRYDLYSHYGHPQSVRVVADIFMRDDPPT